MQRLTTDDIEWWLEHRRSVVWPRHKPCPTDVLVRILPVNNDAATCLPRRHPLFYPPSTGVDSTCIPDGVLLFFRHFFETDQLAYVLNTQRYFKSRGYTPTHCRQLWDFVRDFWFAMGTMAVDSVTAPHVWHFLMDNAHRHGAVNISAYPTVRDLSSHSAPGCRPPVERHWPPSSASFTSPNADSSHPRRRSTCVVYESTRR